MPRLLTPKKFSTEPIQKSLLHRNIEYNPTSWRYYMNQSENNAPSDCEYISEKSDRTLLHPSSDSEAWATENHPHLLRNETQFTHMSWRLLDWVLYFGHSGPFPWTSDSDNVICNIKILVTICCFSWAAILDPNVSDKLTYGLEWDYLTEFCAPSSSFVMLIAFIFLHIVVHVLFCSTLT